MEFNVTDSLWIVVSAGMVFIMQAGFLCLETGLTRSKNHINVAVKNLADFGMSTFFFWLFGFAIMFGLSNSGWIGTTDYAPDFGLTSGNKAIFFFFQVMFCGTAVTILSGAIAERLRFSAYLWLAALVSGLTYPLMGHWVWNGLDIGEATGWLAQRGFVDFAGGTVVHSVGGWSALAVLLIIGPRTGRFLKDGTVVKITGSSIPLATLGTLILYFGWFGFNGGSLLGFNEGVSGVLFNTLLAGSTGLLAAMIVGGIIRGRPDVDLFINGTLAGLVSITAGAHVMSATSAAIVGAIGAIVMLGVEALLHRFKIDDAVSAIPVHLGAGIWGTLAIGLFGNLEAIGTGLSRVAQTSVQLQGVVVCAVWIFLVTYVAMLFLETFLQLRVSASDERIGLNVTEHGEETEAVALLKILEDQADGHTPALNEQINPTTEMGQIAQRYTQVVQELESARATTQAISETMSDGLLTLSSDMLQIRTANKAATQLFEYPGETLTGETANFVLRSGWSEGQPESMAQLSLFLDDAASQERSVPMFGIRSGGERLHLEVGVVRAIQDGSPTYALTIRQTQQEITPIFGSNGF